jgi:hypothetical protein
MKSAFGVDMTVVALKTSDRLRTLERLRDRLAEQCDIREGSRDLALLAARLQSVLTEIDELAPGDGLSPVDEILRRREERRRRGSRCRPVARMGLASAASTAKAAGAFTLTSSAETASATSVKDRECLCIAGSRQPPKRRRSSRLVLPRGSCRESPSAPER